ncbi:hypothetical protein [Vibrio metschnikovii]|uniref:hypothetical protein n=1 Tax=Vibrio metschnikovii TaxID=28172 RepID=UPI001C2F322C|nr:hypothetical protein [Vibrio metschnikovii]EKO3566638.1 hypothetical protein [Vibrio metschnikovii]EKO3769005.1 hypothetical protein [Vibrio metschnikovii]EKO3771493.1 hypothetical protein [Vibrio metschnikovii]
MRYEIKNQEGEWVEGQPKEGELCRTVTSTTMGNAYAEFVYTSPPEQDLTLAKAEKILKIKAEAGRRIELLDWRLERAKEREQLNIKGYETILDVYQLKEDIRQWSDQKENTLMLLDDINDVLNFDIESCIGR